MIDPERGCRSSVEEQAKDAAKEQRNTGYSNRIGKFIANKFDRGLAGTRGQVGGHHFAFDFDNR
jgi:hypothetical protein|tara:strand:- start:19 stop:210 length:192 start_codon:yes stop_codon:yes gene_type:complete